MISFEEYLEGPPAFIEGNDITHYYYTYARDILKGRWIEKESDILINPFTSYLYLSYIIRGRWPGYEDKLDSDPEWVMIDSNFYINNFLKNNWPDDREPKGQLYEAWYKMNLNKIIK